MSHTGRAAGCAAARRLAERQTRRRNAASAPRLRRPNSHLWLLVRSGLVPGMLSRTRSFHLRHPAPMAAGVSGACAGVRVVECGM